jgi:hypothetical protein
MKRALVVGLIAAVVATAAYLLRSRSSGEEPAEVATEPTEPAARAGSSPRRPPSLDARPRTGAGDNNNDGGVGRTEPYRAEHRGEEPSQPRPHRPGDPVVYVVQAPVISSLRRSLRPAIKRCSDANTAGLEPKAVLQGSLTVAVKGGLLTVTDVVVTQRGVPESSPLIECAREAFAAAQVRADGHADVEKHTLRFPFKLPVP